MPVKRRTLPDLVIVVVDRVLAALEQGGETSLAVRQRQRHQISTVEVEQVKDEIDEVGAALSLRGVLDQREGRDAVRSEPAKFSVDIGLPRREGVGCCRDRRIFAGPVEPGAGQQADIAAIEPGMRAIPVEFELMGPLAAAPRFRDEPRKLGLDPCGKLRIRLRVR